MRPTGTAQIAAFDNAASNTFMVVPLLKCDKCVKDKKDSINEHYPRSIYELRVTQATDTEYSLVGSNIVLLRFITDSSEWLPSFAIDYYDKNGQIVFTEYTTINIPISIRPKFPPPCSQNFISFNTYTLPTSTGISYANDWVAVNGDHHNTITISGPPALHIDPWYNNLNWWAVGLQTDNASWVSHPANGNNGQDHQLNMQPNGISVTTYRRTFCATKAMSSTIRFDIAADDSAAIYFNGQHIGSYGTLVVNNLPISSYSNVYFPNHQWITISPPNQQLSIGQNRIDVVVFNRKISNSPMRFPFDAFGVTERTGFIVRNSSITTQFNNLGLTTDYCCNPTARITGKKIWDKNCDGRDNDGSSGISGWTIILRGSDGSVVAQTVTNSNGNYWFNNLLPGTYTIEESMSGQTGWQATSGPATIALLPYQHFQFNFFNCNNISCQDKITIGEQSEECCQTSFRISNGHNVALQSLQYTVSGGVLHSITSVPCMPIGNPNVNGTTSGTLQFDPNCTINNTMSFVVHASSTTAHGQVCIKITPTYKQGNSTFTCNDTTICIQCPRMEKECGKAVNLSPFVQSAQDEVRLVTINNVKIPTSKISSIDISFNPSISYPAYSAGELCADVGSTAAGQNLRLLSRTNSSDYTQLRFNCDASTSFPHLGAAQNWVTFNMAIRQAENYNGVITFKIGYCDGDTCIESISWRSRTNHGTGSVVQNILPINPRIFALNVTPVDSVHFVSISMADTGHSIIAANSTNVGVRTEISKSAALFSTIPERGYSDIKKLDATVVYSSYCPPPTINCDSISLNVKYYDKDAREIGSTTKTVNVMSVKSKVDPPIIVPGDGGVLINSIVPNPASGEVKITYTINANDFVRLELFDMLGKSYGVVENVHRPEGRHEVSYNVALIPEGSYVLRLSTQNGHASAVVKIIH
jgi:hypothetical protein